ncbi:hypothetical protein HGO38_16325 [Rhizobium sp. CG5]|nr:hypothetical protein [Rhizobium sp. CG5]
MAAFDRLGTLATRRNPGQASILPASGLLAMSIPASFGGADISNLIVAETVSRLVTWNTAAAERLLRYLVALDLAIQRGGSAPPGLLRSGLAVALEHVDRISRSLRLTGKS